MLRLLRPFVWRALQRRMRAAAMASVHAPHFVPSRLGGCMGSHDKLLGQWATGESLLGGRPSAMEPTRGGVGGEDEDALGGPAGALETSRWCRCPREEETRASGGAHRVGTGVAMHHSIFCWRTRTSRYHLTGQRGTPGGSLDTRHDCITRTRSKRSHCDPSRGGHTHDHTVSGAPRPGPHHIAEIRLGAPVSTSAGP